MNLPRSIGLQKTSLIDYPAKVASVLFLPGCNMRCSYCHNSDLALGRTEELLSRNKVIEFLIKRAPLLGGVVISGGEPLLHDGLSDLISFIHNEVGLAVKLDTNGILSDKLTSLIQSENKPDYIAMDVKSIPENYKFFTPGFDSEKSLLNSISLIKKSGIPSQFRTTVHPAFLDLSMVDEISEILRDCQEYVLNPFEPGHCLNPDFNSQSPTTAEELRSLKDKFISRGINCKVPSIENS